MQENAQTQSAQNASPEALQNGHSSSSGGVGKIPPAPDLVSKDMKSLSQHPSAASQGDNCALIPGLHERLTVSGPYIVLLECDSMQHIWRASVMIVTPPAQGAVLPAEPTLTLVDQGQTKQRQGLLLDEHAGWKFWRFDLEALLGDDARVLEYSIEAEQMDKSTRYPVALPGKQQGWRWGFHSCNGLSAGADLSTWKDPHLWEDVMAMHREKPLVAMCGGGDQIYNDALWQSPSLQAWVSGVSTHTPKARLEHPFDEAMQQEVTDFLFNHYRVHFQSRPALAQAYACIPQINSADDHDIFDGWGSYPDYLQQCPVFQGIYKCCHRFYLLFQHHTTPELSRSMNGLFGPPGTYSWCRQLGPRVALLGPDCRAERTVHRILSPETYDALFAQVAALPATVKHIVVCATVPIIFPKLPLSELTLTALEDLPFIKGALQKTGLAAHIVDKFGHVDLLDDVIDHWDARTHLGERSAFIERLQAVAKARQARISFVSGDVHVAGIGRLYTRPKMAHLTHDHRFMPQIVSSAIWNCPPPSKLITLLEKTNRSSKVTRNTQEKMVRAFQGGHKLMGARNWCLAEELPYTEQLQLGGSSREASRQQKTSGALLYTLRVEDPANQTAQPKTYEAICPPYIHSPLRNHVAVRRSSLLQRCMCVPKTKEDDPLDEL